MSYSVDLRKRVISFVESGGSKSEAARRFDVSRRTVYNWLALDDLSPKPHPRHTRKVDKLALKRHVQAFPDAMLSERAQLFGVATSTIWYHLKLMKFSRKKNIKVSRKESFQARKVPASIPPIDSG